MTNLLHLFAYLTRPDLLKLACDRGHIYLHNSKGMTPLTLSKSGRLDQIICQYYISNPNSFSSFQDSLKLMKNTHEDAVKCLDLAIKRTLWKDDKEIDYGIISNDQDINYFELKSPILRPDSVNGLIS